MNKKNHPQVVVVGDLNIDLLLKMSNLDQEGRKITGESFTLIPGGNAANQAVAAVRMGVDVSLLGRVGNDAFGEQIQKKMRTENITSDLLHVCSDASTGLSLIIGKAGSENKHIVVRGANALVSAGDIEGSKDYIKNCKALLIGLGIPQDRVLQALEIAAQGTAQVVFSSTQSARLPDRAFGLIDVLVIGSMEATDLLDFDVDNTKSARVAASMLLEKGVRRAVVIHIKEKCMLIGMDEGFATIDAPADMEIIDPTSMEDTFAGVLTACLVKEKDMCDAVETAYLAAAICGSRNGAQESIPSKEELKLLEVRL